jgi:hypothetical protein
VAASPTTTHAASNTQHLGCYGGQIVQAPDNLEAMPAAVLMDSAKVTFLGPHATDVNGPPANFDLMAIRFDPLNSAAL